jgi:hypothetical protein
MARTKKVGNVKKCGVATLIQTQVYEHLKNCEMMSLESFRLHSNIHVAKEFSKPRVKIPLTVAFQHVEVLKLKARKSMKSQQRSESQWKTASKRVCFCALIQP